QRVRIAAEPRTIAGKRQRGGGECRGRDEEDHEADDAPRAIDELRLDFAIFDDGAQDRLDDARNNVGDEVRDSNRGGDRYDSHLMENENDPNDPNDPNDDHCSVALTIGIFKGMRRPLRTTSMLAVLPIAASWMRRVSGPLSVIEVPLNETMMSPGRRPAVKADASRRIRCTSTPRASGAPSSAASCVVSGAHST